MQKKNIFKPNAVDIIIAALLVLAAVSIVLRVIPPSGGERYRITALCEACPKSVKENILKGQTVYDYETKAALGEITAVTDISAAESAESAALTVILSVNAKMHSYGLVSNESDLLIGRYMNLISANSVFCVRIEKIERESAA